MSVPEIFKSEHKWEQTLLTLSVRIKIPPKIPNKDIKVEFKSKFVSVRFKKYYAFGEDKEEFEGELVDFISPDDSMWFIEDGYVVLEMGKVRGLSDKWWDRVLVTNEAQDVGDVEKRGLQYIPFSKREQMNQEKEKEILQKSNEEK